MKILCQLLQIGNDRDNRSNALDSEGHDHSQGHVLLVPLYRVKDFLFRAAILQMKCNKYGCISPPRGPFHHGTPFQELRVR